MHREVDTGDRRAPDVSSEEGPPADPARHTSSQSLAVFKGLIRINRKVVFIEDLIVDRLATKLTTHVRGAVRNPPLKSPFKRRTLFRLEGDSVVFDLKTDVSVLQEALAARSHPLFFTAFQSAFAEVLANRGEFLSLFGKYIFRPGRNFLHGLATFLLFLSLYFKPKYVSFALEFLAVMLAELLRKFGDQKSVHAELIRIISLKEPHWDVAEEQFFGVLGNTKQLFLQPELIVNSFFDYLVDNDFLLGHAQRVE